MSVNPGEWTEYKSETNLFVEAIDDGVEIYISDEDRACDITLTAEQARSVAAKLLEIADDIYFNK